MNKEKILEELERLPIKKDKYIVIGESALVLQEIIEEAKEINLACSKEVYDKIDWDRATSFFDSEIKFFSCFKIGVNFYDIENVIKINDYYITNLESCYELKKIENKKQDQKIIQKLEMLLCEENNYYWYEKRLHKKGIYLIGGVDEVGRGPLVGPVVAACVVLPKHFNLEGLTDSKKLSEKKRNYFFEEIKKQALGIGIGVIDEKTIDNVNIYEATKLAMKEAIKNCQQEVKIDHILIDAMPLDVDIPTTSIIKGDLKSITISAASVIAKVTRDKMMYDLDLKYPMYEFKNNKGYPTKKHVEAIEKYGIIDEHRKSYEPVSSYVKNHSSDNLKIK